MDPPRGVVPRGSQCFGGPFPALQHPLSKGAKGPLDWGVLGVPVARPGVLQLERSHGATLHSAGGIDGHVRFPVFLGGRGCRCGSISLEAQLGGAFLGRGMAGGRQGRAFSP